MASIPVARPLFFFALGALSVAGAHALAGKADATYRKLRIFTQVLNHIEQSYVETVKEDQLVYGAVNGMMHTLDPHSVFMPPDEYRKLKEDTAGEFGGLGLEIEQRGEVIVVLAPIEGSPAARAGMLPGDVIIAVDGQSLEGVRLEDAWRHLRGPAGTKLVLKIRRTGWAEPKDVALVRERVRVDSVVGSCLEPGFAEVRIKSFQERVGKELHEELTRLGAQCAAPNKAGLKGLVLDLRNNPGGLLEEAVRVADEFLLDGEIVTTQGRDARPLARHRAHAKDTQPVYPMIVLVNEGTASASEIVAGALQDHGRAVVMGTPSFGKGSVQTIMELEDGSGLKLTVARYFTPSGRSIQERGIVPDIRVEAGTLPDGDADPAQGEKRVRERDLRRHLRNPAADAGPAPGKASRDAQIQTAVAYLKGWQIFAGSGLLGKDGARP